MKTAEEKYRDDPLFHRAVDVMGQFLDQHFLTPGELREAVMLAAYLHEARSPLPQLSREADFRRRLEERRIEREAAEKKTTP